MRDFGYGRRKRPKLAAGSWKGGRKMHALPAAAAALPAARQACERQEQMGTTRRRVIRGRNRTISAKLDQRTRNPLILDHEIQECGRARMCGPRENHTDAARLLDADPTVAAAEKNACSMGGKREREKANERFGRGKGGLHLEEIWNLSEISFTRSLFSLWLGWWQLDYARAQSPGRRNRHTRWEKVMTDDDDKKGRALADDTLLVKRLEASKIAQRNQ